MMRFFPLFILGLFAACGLRTADAPLNLDPMRDQPLWIAPVRNSTQTDLRLPSGNPLRSLGEMAGKVSSDDRPTLMNLLRAALRRELEQRKVRARYPEDYDARLKTLPSGAEAAARAAREAGLQGVLLLSEIRRWEFETPGLIRLWVEFHLVRIADGTVAGQRRVQKVVPAGRSGNPAEAHQDAVREIVKEFF